MLDNMIDKEFINQIIELDNGWIETPNGIFTPNDEQGLSAYEVYENYLYNLNNPPTPQPTLEEKVQLQEDKISILENENLLVKESLKLVLAGDMYSLAKVLYPEDFEGVCELK